MNKWLILAGLAVAGPAAAQQPDCKAFHTGTYRIADPDGSGYVTVVTRTRTRQTELANGEQPGGFAVKWLDDCTYQLTPDAAFRAANPGLPADATLTVRITATTAKGYSFETSSTFAPTVVRGTAERVQPGTGPDNGQTY